MKKEVKMVVLLVRGLVQGVGFRPFVYRIAQEMGIKGEVDNRNDGVYIRAFLSPQEKKCFVKRILTEHPPVASIHHIVELEDRKSKLVYSGFFITPSRNGSDEVTQVSPDIAVCANCLADRTKQPHRLHYPFINCTHCGPRFTIIRDLPYDRNRTTMSHFAMCPVCKKEYSTVTDRRFHAQPVACSYCGPYYYAVYKNIKYVEYPDLLNLSALLISRGEIIAVKGIGGYHLVCDALNEEAVMHLREIKRRDKKPFAVMFRDVKTAKTYVQIDEAEEKCLLSWRRPIVLLKQKEKHTASPLAKNLNPGMHTVGGMLPYMPIHYDWFERLDTPVLVMTSGNLSNVPVAIIPDEAEKQLCDKVPLVLHHNRDIYNRADDSVVQVCGGQPCLIRRARGYVPEPFFTGIDVEGILAFGAEKVNTFAIGKGDSIIQSQYIGDLTNWETYQFYTESMERFQRLFRFKPRKLVCDLHPDYFSSRVAARLAKTCDLPLLRVQHHHAHATACMLEHGLSEPVIALVMDGTGLGEDGRIWGGEFFLCDRARYKRLAHFEYIPMPGGDKASEEPWRMATAYLWHYGLPFPKGFIERIGYGKVSLLQKMMNTGMNCPYTSGAGRLFDAIASLTGLCDVATYQAEAPVLLEQAAIEEPEQIIYPFQLNKEGIISFRLLFEKIMDEIKGGVPVGVISTRFHRTFAIALKTMAEKLLKTTGVEKVVLSGGCFQNKLLIEILQQQFIEAGIPLYIPSHIPCNDSGIAVGQLAVASARTTEEYKHMEGSVKLLY